MNKTHKHDKLSVSIGLLQSLRPKHHNRFTRSEAFFDLLCRVLDASDNGKDNCTDPVVTSDTNPAHTSSSNSESLDRNREAVKQSTSGSDFGSQGDNADKSQGRSSDGEGLSRHDNQQKLESSGNRNAPEICDTSSTGHESDGIHSLRQFDTNYSQLATLWKWNRETVHPFLKLLETEGLLLYEQTGKRLSIYIDI